MKFILVLFLIWGGFLRAQTDSIYYKKVLSKDMYIGSSLFRNIFMMVMDGSKDGVQNDTYFLPNQIGKISVDVSHPKIPFDIGFGFGFGAVSKKLPKTKSIGIQVHKYMKNFVVDVDFQRYSGFYINNFVNYRINNNLSYNERSFPDLKVMLIGLSGQYIFNGDEFSYQAAFNNAKTVQLKSAGSSLLGVQANYFDVNSGKPIFNATKDVKEIQYGLNAGYSYNFVLSKKWFANVSASLGANINTNFKFRPSYLARGSCFYTSGDWSLGVLGVTNTLSLVRKRNLYGTLTSGIASFRAVRRFKLKKTKKSL